MRNKQLSIYGLKFNPFTHDIPTHALWINPQADNFCFGIEQQTQHGGFSLVTGNPGLGKTSVMRILEQRLKIIPEINVAVATRPQASLGDFYREIGDLFGVQLTPHNRWAGTQSLTQKWKHHIETTLCRPVIIIDEAQEASPKLLNELRLLSSTDLDSCNVLTVALCGDDRLQNKLTTPDMLPLNSRIRNRLILQEAHPEQLQMCLEHTLTQAGNPNLLTQGLKVNLANHAMGNTRIMMNMANELLTVAIKNELSQIDEKLFLQTFHTSKKNQKRK